MINTTIKHFKKGEYVKVVNGFNKDVIGIVLRCDKGIHSNLIFTTIQTTNNKRIHGLNEAFKKITPCKNDKQKIKLYEKLRLLNWVIQMI